MPDPHRGRARPAATAARDDGRPALRPAPPHNSGGATGARRGAGPGGRSTAFTTHYGFIYTVERATSRPHTSPCKVERRHAMRCPSAHFTPMLFFIQIICVEAAAQRAMCPGWPRAATRWPPRAKSSAAGRGAAPAQSSEERRRAAAPARPRRWRWSLRARACG